MNNRNLDNLLCDIESLFENEAYSPFKRELFGKIEDLFQALDKQESIDD